jgi:hypothetical protein
MQETTEIEKIIRNWLTHTIHKESIPHNVIALNFDIQRTYDEYEIFQTGHDDFYYDHDTWLLSQIYEPKENFIGLGISSLALTDSTIFEIYKSEVTNFLINSLNLFPKNIKYFTCKYPGGVPELIFEI